ncbi:unnamed protein product [Haemonchus placei]|uniref:Uncharacterized protein n=1 Tax=Haemonchus placei TaxID=6290 RepID=A0A158QMT5_HAEPC|nr:unnamed protein product [Haemonchus placei]
MTNLHRLGFHYFLLQIHQVLHCCPTGILYFHPEIHRDCQGNRNCCLEILHRCCR